MGNSLGLRPKIGRSMLKCLCPALCTALYRPSLAASNATAHITWSPDMPLCRDWPFASLPSAVDLRLNAHHDAARRSRRSIPVYHLDPCCEMDPEQLYDTTSRYIVDALYGKLNDMTVLHPKSYNMYDCVGGCKSFLLTQNVGHPATLGIGTYWKGPPSRKSSRQSASVCAHQTQGHERHIPGPEQQTTIRSL